MGWIRKEEQAGLGDWHDVVSGRKGESWMPGSCPILLGSGARVIDLFESPLSGGGN